MNSFMARFPVHIISYTSLLTDPPLRLTVHQDKWFWVWPGGIKEGEFCCFHHIRGDLSTTFLSHSWEGTYSCQRASSSVWSPQVRHGHTPVLYVVQAEERGVAGAELTPANSACFYCSCLSKTALLALARKEGVPRA